MEDIDDEIEIISRPTKSKPRNEDPRSILSDKDRYQPHPSPLKEISAISVISRRDQSARDHNSSPMGLDERTSKV